MDGICTLGNDKVAEQIIALLNSIEINGGKDIPVCIYPYDDNISKLAQEIAHRPNVQIYDNRDSIAQWDSFAQAAWDTHPTAPQRWAKTGNTGYYRFGTHRRYCAFDGPFDRFVYMDADTVLMSSLETIFNQLEEHDCVVYDYQYKDLTHVYEATSPALTTIFTPERLQKEIFCSGFYASKKDLFDLNKRQWLVEQLANKEAQILYPLAPDQTLINYMMMRSGFSVYNLALNLPFDKKTGCSVTSTHFVNQNNILYDKGNPLTYLHYIGISSQFFSRLCAGENIDFPYREIYLHYRYLHEPQNRPRLTGKPKPYNQPPSFLQKVKRKLQRMSS